MLAVGQVNTDWLVQDFILMASDQNEKHEENIDREFKHGDGWGIAYLNKNKFKIFRSEKAVYEDSQIEQFKNIETNFLILHARKATTGKVVLKNVHPFEYKMNGHHYCFFHNGTVRDEIHFENRFQPVGTTDSERLFYHLLTDTNGYITESQLRSRLSSIQDFTAANFMLTDGALTYVTSWYSENPNYYTFKVLQKPGIVIVSSEVLPHYKSDDWSRLKNQDIVSVRTSDLKVEIN